MLRGLRLLSAGHVVVTERLHGHVLCLLAGIPHVVLDNSYGKVRAFVEAWTAGHPLVRWADDSVSAAGAARQAQGALPGAQDP
jgi:pyruvyl transferase EpsO